MKSKTPSPLQEKEHKNESYKSYVANDKNFPPLQAATKQGACSLSKDGGVLKTHNVLKKHTFILACTVLGQYAAKVIRLRRRLLQKLRRPVQLLRRRLKLYQVYQHGDSQMSYDELLSFEQNLDQLRTFTERGKMMVLRDFNGENLDLKKTGNTDITSYIAMFEVQRKANGNKCDSTEKKN